MTQEISIYEHAVRKLRFMRITGEAQSEIERKAKNFQYNLGLDAAKLIKEAKEPGSIDGFPYSRAAQDNSK